VRAGDKLIVKGEGGGQAVRIHAFRKCRCGMNVIEVRFPDGRMETTEQPEHYGSIVVEAHADYCKASGDVVR